MDARNTSAVSTHGVSGLGNCTQQMRELQREAMALEMEWHRPDGKQAMSDNNDYQLVI